MPRVTTTNLAGKDVYTVRRYCVKCHAVSRLRRLAKRCPVCGELFDLTKDAQTHWVDPHYRPEVTGEPPMKIEQPWLPGLEPEEEGRRIPCAR